MKSIDLNILNSLQTKLENSSVDNEYSRAILSSIADVWDGIKETEGPEKEKMTYLEVQRVAARTEIMFCLIDGLLEKSIKESEDAIKQIVQLKEGGKLEFGDIYGK